MLVALKELASRQTGTDSLTHFSVRRSYGIRKARLGTKALEDLIWLWLLLLEGITALCSSCMRHIGQTWHWWHWGSGVKPACACSLLSSQLAEYLLWDPAGGWQGPAEGNIWPIAVTKCPHHLRSHQVKCYLPRCGTWISSRRPLFVDGIFKLHECHKPYQGFYTM